MAPLSDNGMDGIIAIILIFVVLSGFIVAFYAHTNGTETHSIQLTEGENEVIKPPLETVLQSKSPTDINVSVYDTENSINVSSGTLGLGETATVSLRGKSINITYLIDVSNTRAVVSYEIPVSYSWDSIAVLFIGSVGLIVIGLFLYIILETLNFRGDSR